MSSLATRRLIDAAATLDPADRALLNLWVNRGLADERLTKLTGMSIETLQTRRGKIVARLAAELELPEQDIRGALEQISPHEVVVTQPHEELVTQPHEEVVSQPHEELVTPAHEELVTPPAPEEITVEPPARNGAASPTHPDDKPSSSPPRRRRGLWLRLTALAIVVAAVIVVVAGGESSPPKVRRLASTATTPTTVPQAAALPAPHPTGGPVPVALAGLPGGLAHASGTVKLSGPNKHLRLKLTVRALPAPHDGHYEVWLYNSVLDSRPLARLRAGRHHLVARLPAHARRYRWIDISFQPVGVIYHSGESVLRASNPAHTTTARLRKRSSRTRRRLRQASKVLAAHPATTRKTKAANRKAKIGNHKSKAANRKTKAADRRTKARSRTRGQRRRSHRPKRRARGSRKSKTSK